MQTNKSFLTVWQEFAINQFHQALRICNDWERDQQRHDIGEVQLSFARSKWIVLVSQDLIDRELPF